MKNIFIGLFLSIFSVNVMGQSMDCCDSLIKFYNGKTVRKKCTISTKKQDDDTCILINNSHSGNTTFLFKSKKNDKETVFDIFFKYFKELLGPLVALFGILVALPILKKKLLENHITNALNKIQEVNKQVHKMNQNLIDEYVPRTFTNEILTKTDIETILKEIKDVYYLSLEGSSDAGTILFYLKNTIQGILKHYDPPQTTFIDKRELYRLIIDVLEITNFYCTQIVQIPKSAKTETKNLINEKIKKYVTHSDYSKYKFFNQGVINDPHSAHFTLFYSRINSCNSSLIKRAAFQIYFNSAPVAKLLYLNEIYAPPEIEKQHLDPLFGTNKLQLFLIGFRNINQLKADGTTKKMIGLIYSNPDDFGRFASNLQFITVKDHFKDSFITASNFDLNKAQEMTHTGIETFELKFDSKYLKEKYNELKRKFKRNIESSVKNQ